MSNNYNGDDEVILADEVTVENVEAMPMSDRELLVRIHAQNQAILEFVETVQREMEQFQSSGAARLIGKLFGG